MYAFEIGVTGVYQYLAQNERVPKLQWKGCCIVVAKLPISKNSQMFGNKHTQTCWVKRFAFYNAHDTQSRCIFLK